MPGYTFHPPANSIRKRKRLKYEGSAYLRKTCHNYAKAKKLQSSTKTKKQLDGGTKVCKGLETTEHFVVTTKNTTNRCSRVFHKQWQKAKPDMCKL